MNKKTNNILLASCLLFLLLVSCQQDKSTTVQGIYISEPVPFLKKGDSTFLLITEAGHFYDNNLSSGTKIKVTGEILPNNYYSYIVVDSINYQGTAPHFRNKTVQYGNITFNGVLKSLAAMAMNKKTRLEAFAVDNAAFIVNDNKLKHFMIRGKRGKDISKILTISPNKQSIEGLLLNQNGLNVIYVDDPNIKSAPGLPKKIQKGVTQ